MVSVFLTRPVSLEHSNNHSVLVDEDASKTGDLYIRSVCFSPDGKFLATGAEDKQIRVRACCLLSTALQTLTSFITLRICAVCRSGTLQKNASATHLKDISKRFTHSTSLKMAD